MVSTEKGDGWWVHACVPTLHSENPKVSQAVVRTAEPGHGVDGPSFPLLLQPWVLDHDTCPCPAAVV